jgi:HEAT repeat protein
MRRIRIPWGTVLPFPVILVCLAAPGARAEGGDLERASRLLLRAEVPVRDRLAAAETLLAAPALPDPEAAWRGGMLLLADAPATADWLLVKAADEAFLAEELRQTAREAVGPLLGRADAAPGDRAAWAAAGLLAGLWEPGVREALAAAFPPAPAVLAVLRRQTGLDAGALTGLPALGSALERAWAAAEALDRAARDDAETARGGLDRLRQLGDAALPVLLAAAAEGEADLPPGRLPRTTRAILVLGLLGLTEATAPLMALVDAPNGWVQVTATTALGDLGDPAAAVVLCHKIAYRGDVLRRRDEWTFPGERETNVKREDWPTVEYFATDCAAADALLRLGANGAVGWLIQNTLDPARANFRIRVLQDSVDALRRAVPSAPVAAYNIDGGFPARREAFHALLAWWRAHALDPNLLGRAFPRDDEGFRREARRMVERLRGQSIMELQISQESCALLGPAITPTLIETLAATDSRVLRTEIARALGVVRDLAAVEPLIGLLAEPTEIVRSVAAGSLGSYVDASQAAFAALVRTLDDPQPGPRVAALKSLALARPSAALLAALRAHDSASHEKVFGMEDREYRVAEQVALLVQEGDAHWAEVRQGLLHAERAVRRAWWDLLKTSLGLPPDVYDATPAPDAPTWRAPDEAAILAALSARRAP